MKNVLPFVVSLSSPTPNRYENSKKRLEYILGLINREKLFNFTVVDWDLTKEDWVEDVPYFFKDKASILKWVLLSIYSQNKLNGFSGSQFIFKELERKIIIDVKQVNNGKGGIQVSKELVAKDIDGKENFLLKLEVIIAPDCFIDISPMNLNCRCKISEDGIYNRKDLVSMSKSLASCEGAIKVVDEVHRHISSIEQIFENQVQAATNVLKSFGIDRGSFVKFVKIVYANFLLSSSNNALSNVMYIPAKGFIDPKTNIEESGGGFHCEYINELGLGKELLLILATIWFRENSINDWAKKTEMEIRKGGTKAAVAALMGRCMSHNIGSHALHHLEQNERKKCKEGIGTYDLRAKFYNYLRERMDFVAAAATQMPVWTKTMEVKDLIDGIVQNKLLLQNIAKSEKVNNVIIECENRALEVAILGGVIGAQAFYIILENIARDAAKYGSKSKSPNMKLNVQVLELSKQEFGQEALEEEELKSNFLKIVVSDDRSCIQQTRKDNDTTDTCKQIEEAIEMLESKGLCDEKGELLPGNWGIKERYIAATFLRGESWEDILLGSTKPCLLPPILRVNDTGKLTWIFFLLKPKEALVIKDSVNQNVLHEKNRQKVEVRDWNWLQEAINRSSTHLRAQFVVLYPNTRENVKILKEILPYLSYHVIICSQSCINNPLEELNGKHCITDNLSLDKENLLLELRRKWVNFLRERKELGYKLKVNFYREDCTQDWRNWLVSEDSNLSMENGDDGFRVVIDRHANNRDKYFPLLNGNEGGSRMLKQNVIHYEPHDGGFSVERIETALEWGNNEQREELIFGVVEAATIRLLVIDERLDEDVDKMPKEFNSIIKFRDLLSAKGITIKGREYAGESTVPDKDSLIEWTKSDFGRSNKPYDFVLLHQGIIDKVHKHHGGKEKKVAFTEKLIKKIKEQGVWDVIVHSGRGPQELPEQVKFLGLSNVEAWIMRHASKCDIIQELMALRIRK